MRKINKPTEISEDVYLTCVNMVQNTNLKARLTAAQNLIKRASEEFERKITTGTMNTILRENIVNNNITKKELEQVYTYRMAKKKASGRPIYDKILLSAKLGICPFCSQRQATTLDHYLPKTEYPRLTVAPINLVPCCKDCNDVKDTLFPTTANQELIHPYYDDIENDSWLNASVIQTTPCTIQYSVVPPNIWTTLLTSRVLFHFEKLELGKLYSVLATVEVSMIQAHLQKLLAISGIESVRKYLSDEEESRSYANLNSWQAVFYRTAKNDDWFCNGGFNS